MIAGKPRTEQPHGQPEAIHEPGALRQWWIELENGSRTAHTLDALFRAGCAEASARDWVRLGLHGIAKQERLRAAEIVLSAAKSGEFNK